MYIPLLIQWRLKDALFTPVDSELDFPKLEHRILRLWTEIDAFNQRRALNKGKPRWSFIDGPITANNPMGVHHAWGRTYKDLFQRYKAMKGFQLRYQNGFDCQGLWIEVELEKELGFRTKREIEHYGVAEFVKKCKQRVLNFAAKQVEQSIRLGYWMEWDDTELLRELAAKLERPDETITVQGPSGGTVKGTVEQVVGQLGTPEFGGSYFTFSDENNYTIWTVLKKCHERGWIRRGRDVMPWCPRCSTALSEHEIATEGYRELTHLGLTVKFPLRERRGESLLVWTTTPWTLSSNVAVAVHPNLVYAKVAVNGEVLILAKAALQRMITGKFEVVEELDGMSLQGLTYNGPYDDLEAVKDGKASEAHRVLPWNLVSEFEGTGIVHIAPGCGREDFRLGLEHGLPVIAPLDEFGVFTKGFGWLTGRSAYDVAQPVVEDLNTRGLLFKLEKYTHRYPVCWRCESELVFRLVDEWFIKMGEKLGKPLEQLTEEEKTRNLRYQIMESATQVCWIPSFGMKQELDWLQNMEDWMISKKRYWGLALPIWECSQCGGFDVVGDEDELRTRAVEGWEVFNGHTPHKPWVDAIRIRCLKCGAFMSRIPDVGNPWLDAGIVAYSTLNYRHDKDLWTQWFPADLICESLPGQFRNWFYSMLAMSTILENRTPFMKCFGHGTVLAEDGREMHKSWGNAIWFDDAVETMGADVMRWMYCSSKHEEDLLFGYKKAEEVKRSFLLPLWNVYSFFITYANIDCWKPGTQPVDLTILDRWLIAKLQVLIEQVTECLENYDVKSATVYLERFVEGLSTWYVRRSRRRFWKSEVSMDKNAGYTTLHQCLITLATLLAPFLPFLSEEIYRNLVYSVKPEAHQSVHLNGWPAPDKGLVDLKLLADMDLAIKVSSLGRAARNKAGIKLRQPLAKAVIASKAETLDRLKQFSELIRDELNVKELGFGNSETILTYSVKLLPEVLGPKYGVLLQKIRDVVAGSDQHSLALRLRGGEDVRLEVSGRVITLLADEVEVEISPKAGYVIVEEEGILVGVNTMISEELQMEGLARDIVRRIQDQRKEAGYNIADTIQVFYEAGVKLSKVFTSWGTYIAAETLAASLENVEPPIGSHIATYKLDGETLKVGLIRYILR